jgi:hypothetical protein
MWRRVVQHISASVPVVVRGAVSPASRPARQAPHPARSLIPPPSPILSEVARSESGVSIPGVSHPVSIQPPARKPGLSFECSAACEFAATLDTPDCIYIRYLMGRAAAGWPDALAFPTRFLGALPVRYAPYLCISGLSHREGWRLGHRARWLQAAHAGWNVSVSEHSQLTYPFETVCSPLGHSGNPGVNGESYRGEVRTVHAWAGSALAHKLVRKGAHHVCTMYACFLPDIDFHTPVLPVQPLPPTVFVYQVYLTGGGGVTANPHTNPCELHIVSVPDVSHRGVVSGCAHRRPRELA